MARPRVTVVGLGPGDARFLTRATYDAMEDARHVRLRTRRHPAASEFQGAASYDDWYETAESFVVLYDKIVDDLIGLAATGPVVYAVPGSPLVAEATVERLVARTDVDVTIIPAVSAIDVACAALRIDPMSASLRIVDALAGGDIRGPGATLLLQTYSPEVMATVSDRIDANTDVCVVFHAGLEDEELRWMKARELSRVADADHLTSLYIPHVRDAGDAVIDLVSLMMILREKCAWDQEQTHASLARHLLEESYEVIDALEKYAQSLENGDDCSLTAAHVEEELGDLLFQIVFHAHLGTEEGTFSLASIADAVHRKLIDRHPHVFGDVTVANADDAESRWEQLKKKEKQRDSVTDGIAWELPGFVLHAKLLRKAASVGVATADEATAMHEVRDILLGLEPTDLEAWRQLVGALSVVAKSHNVDIEGMARSLAVSLRDEIVAAEGLASS